MALYFVGLFIFIVSIPFSNVTTSSLYLLSTSTDGLFWGFGDFKSSWVVPNCAEIFKQNSLYICPEQRNKNLIPPTQFYHQIFPILLYDALVTERTLWRARHYTTFYNVYNWYKEKQHNDASCVRKKGFINLTLIRVMKF